MLPHPQNPRKQLIVDELSISIKESGLLSPLLVRRVNMNQFQIISGHRRKAALEQMGEKYADVDIIEMNDEQAYKALMTANIQSQSLSEVEEADGIKHMMDTYEWTQDRVAKEFGKSQVWVNRRLDLLHLDAGIQEQIITRVITATHGREIGQLPPEKQPDVARQVVEEKLSTRQTAELVKQINNPQIDDSTNYREFQDSPLTDLRSESQKDVKRPLETSHQFDGQSETIPQIDDRLDHPKPEETRLYADPDMKRISEMNGFILKLKDIELDLQPHVSVMDSLVEFNRSDEALRELDKIAFRLDWMRKHITNAKARLEGGTGEGTVLEFKRKEA